MLTASFKGCQKKLQFIRLFLTIPDKMKKYTKMGHSAETQNNDKNAKYRFKMGNNARTC